MISRVLYALETALGFLKQQTQLQFVLVLIVVLPLVFLYTSNAFLEAGRANQDKLQRDRIGVLHDVFASALVMSDFNITGAQLQIEQLVKQNPDITKFRILQQQGSELIIVASEDTAQLGNIETATDLFLAAAVRTDESLIFPFSLSGERYWQAVRSIKTESSTWYLFNEISFMAVDRYLESREQRAYLTLGMVYLVLIAIAYWLYRLTNYQALYREAKRAIETKDLFTNMMAHELRAPLSAMRGYSSMIADSANDPETVRTYAGRITTASDRLLAVVTDLLDVARIQSGKLEINRTKTNITAIIKAVQDELSPSAAEKHIALHTSGVGADHLAYADAKRLQQAITNLVSNAIKYTKEGSITLELTEQPRTIELRVKDTGMGISAADQKQLFAPFFRVQSKDVSEITGSGLGMWITRQLIEQMGGIIGVESIKNVGTHIVIELPREDQSLRRRS